MKNPKKIIRIRRYTTRLNIICSLILLTGFIWSVVDYSIKLKHNPNLPLIAMFFKIETHRKSWDLLTSFN